MQFLDDYQPGQRFVTAARLMSEDAAKDFATAFDPQPFHLDADAAADSTFGKLVVSGWHTAALTMRLMVDSDFQPANGIVGFRVDELNWKRPVSPGDRLHAVMEVLAVTPSRSKPDRGVLKLRISTINQEDEAVQDMTANLLVMRRPDAG